jgi:purine-binding chemotaxis protein CheW
VLAAGAPPLALAFHELDGHIRVPAASILAETRAQQAGDCLRGMVPLAGGTRPIVDLPAARAAVHALTGHEGETRA